ncbi:MAG: nucleoside recognition protein [Roseburia sp.]|nr:nucleoside recognition protein [Roseburia sp.]
MNYLWAGMILIGVVFAAFTGRLPEVANAALDSAKEAVTLCITMTGVMSFWVGLMKIAEKSGIIAGLSRRLRPVLRFLFPGIPEGHVANEYIATNIIANVFGLGWAATPAGLRAMEALQELNLQECERNGITKRRAPDIATEEMCNFLIVNISSLQLISVNIIAYRSQYGSVNPTAIVGPGIVATICSTVAAIIFCKVMSRKQSASS